MHTKIMIILVLILLISGSTFAEIGFKDRPITNVVLMPTGYTLQKGEFIYGIGLIEYGITNRLQIGTDILLSFLAQHYNLTTKMTFIESSNMAFAMLFGLNYSGKSDDFIYTPMISLSRTINSNFNLHFAGQFRIAPDDIEEQIDPEPDFRSYLSLGMDYNITKKIKLLSETGYDFANNGYYVSSGVLFGWEEFRLKLGIGYYKPNIVYLGSYPVGFWFRFK